MNWLWVQVANITTTTTTATNVQIISVSALTYLLTDWGNWSLERLISIDQGSNDYRWWKSEQSTATTRQAHQIKTEKRHKETTSLPTTMTFLLINRSIASKQSNHWRERRRIAINRITPNSAHAFDARRAIAVYVPTAAAANTGEHLIQSNFT